MDEDVAANRERLRQMMKIQEIQLTEPIVAYCRGNAPEAAKSLEEGYANYVALMEAAYESWIQQLSDEDLSGTPTPNELQEMSAKITELSGQMLSSVRQRDPHIYCPWLADRLRAYTRDTAKRAIVKAQTKLKAARDARQR